MSTEMQALLVMLIVILLVILLYWWWRGRSQPTVTTHLPSSALPPTAAPKADISLAGRGTTVAPGAAAAEGAAAKVTAAAEAAVAKVEAPAAPKIEVPVAPSIPATPKIEAPALPQVEVPAAPKIEVPAAPEVAAAVSADDLGKIEGIGPKIAGILKANGIASFAQLASLDPDKISDMLKAEGLQFADPTTWPEQAKLAATGDWKGLEVLQDTLKGGRRVSVDNLIIIEGIGLKIAGILRAQGITTFAQLARTDVAKLRAILDANKLPFIDPGTWAEQAELAAKGKMDELKALQESLKGGRRA